MKTGSLVALTIALTLALGACKEKIEADQQPAASGTVSAEAAVTAPAKAKPKRVTPERIEEIKASGRTGFWTEVTAVCPRTHEATLLTWNIPDGASRYVVYVVDKDGVERNFGQGGPVGEKMTGPWLRPGVVFKLRSAGDNKEAASLEIAQRTDCP